MTAVLLLASLASRSIDNAAASTHAAQLQKCVFNQSVLSTPANSCRPHAIRYPSKVRGSVKRAIYDGALTFGVPYTTLLLIAKCESRLNIWAANSGHLGLFQFAAPTFSGGAKSMRKMTGVVAKTVWGARDSSYVAGFLFATGGDEAWTCLSQVRAPNSHFLAFQGRPHGEALP